MNNNETIGQTAEASVCSVYNLKFNINDSRIDKDLMQKFNPIINNGLKDKYNIIKSLGYKNGAVDFNYLEDVEEKSLSLKTLKRKEGKICPQTVGQPSIKSWDNRWGTSKNENGEITLSYNGLPSDNYKRFEFIKNNIGTYLNCMLDNTFCCDTLVLLSNCLTNKPVLEILEKPYFNFAQKNIEFTRPVYEERWNPKKNKYSEFSTTVKVDIDQSKISVGEFQFHFKSRQVIKFRFFKKFLKLAKK